MSPPFSSRYETTAFQNDIFFCKVNESLQGLWNNFPDSSLVFFSLVEKSSVTGWWTNRMRREPLHKVRMKKESVITVLPFLCAQLKTQDPLASFASWRITKIWCLWPRFHKTNFLVLQTLPCKILKGTRWRRNVPTRYSELAYGCICMLNKYSVSNREIN